MIGEREQRICFRVISADRAGRDTMGLCPETADHSVLVTRSGNEVAIQVSAAPICDRGGRVMGAVIVFHDVTAERRLKRALAWQGSLDRHYANPETGAYFLTAADAQGLVVRPSATTDEYLQIRNLRRRRLQNGFCHLHGIVAVFNALSHFRDDSTSLVFVDAVD